MNAVQEMERAITLTVRAGNNELKKAAEIDTESTPLKRYLNP